MRNRDSSDGDSEAITLRPNERPVTPRTGRVANRAGKEWTKEEDAIVRAYYSTKGSIPVAEMLGRTMTSVQCRARGLGIPGTCKWWSNKEEVFLRRNYDKLTAPKIAKRLGRTVQSVRAHILKLDLTNSTARTWTPDEETYMRTHYGKVRVRDLAEELGRSMPSVELKARRMKLLVSAPARLSKAQVKWVRVNFGKLSFAEMSRRLGFNVRTIARIAHAAGFRSRPNNRVWTKAEDDYMRRHYGSKSRKEIAVALGRTIPTVQRRAQKLGLTTDQPKVTRSWTSNEEAVVKRWYGKKTCREIGLMLDRTEISVRGKVAQLGLGKKGKGFEP